MALLQLAEQIFRDSGTRNLVLQKTVNFYGTLTKCDIQFLDESPSARKRYKDNGTNGELKCFRLIHAESFLVNFSICKTCALVFFPFYYPKFVDSPPDPESIPFLRFLSISHTNLAKFIYHNTEIWIQSIFNVLYWIKHTKDSFLKCSHGKWLAGNVYQSLHENLDILTHHLILFRKKHWKIMTFKTTLFFDIMEFVESELDYRTSNQKHNEELASHNILCVISVLLSYWICYLRKCKKFKILKHNQRIIQLTQKLHELKIILFKREGFDLILAKEHETTFFLVCVLSESLQQDCGFEQIIHSYALKFWEKRRNDQCCIRQKCNAMRENSNKFLKCSSCLVAIYCSKKCAKLDWKYGYHKKYCADYRQMIQKRINISKWMKSSTANLPSFV
eukprot:428096_1